MTEIDVFKKKSERHWLALSTIPGSRALELLPLLSFVQTIKLRSANQKDFKILDLMAGCGYSTKQFAKIFDSVVAVDGCPHMLQHCPSDTNITRILINDIGESPIPSVLGKFDVISSLAGLHHVIVTKKDGTIDCNLSSNLQADVIKRWASILKDDGIILIADVPHQSIPSSLYLNTDFEMSIPLTIPNTTQISKNIAHRWELLIGEIFSHTDRVVEASSYVECIKPFLGDGIFISQSKHAIPADWFINVVKHETVFGHKEYFINPDSLKKTLKNYGLHSEFCILPTPWIFNSEIDLAWYMHEKFGFGNMVQSKEKFPQKDIDKILEFVKEYLGISKRDRYILIGWNLCFMLVKKLRM